MRIRKSVEELEPYVPGEQPRDKSVIKLNTNENPYLPSPLVKKALESFDPEYLRKYPDPVFTDLRARIAEIHGTVPARVFIGNGSDEVLSLACRAFGENDEAIGSFDPSYSLYRTLAAIRDVSFVPSPLGPGFAWSDPVEKGADGKDVALFLLTNPNAPTSVQYPKEKIANARSVSGMSMIRSTAAILSSLGAIPSHTPPNPCTSVSNQRFSIAIDISIWAKTGTRASGR